MWQDTRVQHIGVGYDDMPGLANLAPDLCRSITIKGERVDFEFEILDDAVQLEHLILRQRLGREEVQRPRLRFRDCPRQYRQVVAKRLARCCRCNDGYILATLNRIEDLRLMTIEFVNTALVK